MLRPLLRSKSLVSLIPMMQRAAIPANTKIMLGHFRTITMMTAPPLNLYQKHRNTFIVHVHDCNALDEELMKQDEHLNRTFPFSRNTSHLIPLSTLLKT